MEIKTCKSSYTYRGFVVGLLCLWLCLISNRCVLAQDAVSVDTLLDKIETRYANKGFSARFFQTSTIKALQITDQAQGSVLVQHPGKMRWEYESPEKQLILSDGNTLWVWRPEDQQVMKGRAADYFGGGKGAGFLSDIQVIREQFSITLESENSQQGITLKLIPKDKKFDIDVIYLLVDSDTYDIRRITTYNSYGDETRIDLTSLKFHQHLDPGNFRFSPPRGTDILQLDN